MEDIALGRRAGRSEARGNVLLEAQRGRGLPGRGAPHAARAVVAYYYTALAHGTRRGPNPGVEAGVNTPIPALKAAGAQRILDILISKIVE